MRTALANRLEISGIRTYELVIDGADGLPVTLHTDTPAGILCWAERQKISQPFEVREGGRRLAKVQLDSDVWHISP